MRTGLETMAGSSGPSWLRVAQRWLSSEQAGVRVCVLIALGLVLVVNLPMLVVGTIFGGDDWAWLWVYRVQGAAALQGYMVDIVHTGFGPVLNFFFFMGGEEPGRLARVFAIAFHLANGWMVWRIFMASRSTPAFAALVAVLYLMAPYSAGLHGSLAHAQYDFFIFCYLVSILLGARRGYVAGIVAIAAMVLGLSIETMIALESLRWWLLYRSRGSIRAAIVPALPFLGIIVLFAIARATVMVPGAHYAGYNAVKRLNLSEYVIILFQHLQYFAGFMEPLRNATVLVRYDSLVLLLPLLVGVVAVAFAFWRSGDGPSERKLALFALLGAVILGAGMLPYIAIGRVLSRIDFDARFAVASQFGVLILIAVAIHLLRFKAIRVIVVAGLVFVFAGVQLQLTKWMLYEQLVISDFHRQLVPYLARTEPQQLVVTFKPASREFLYLNRPCLSSYDNNVALELKGARHGSMVYDRECLPEQYVLPTDCRTIAFDQSRPCPAMDRKAEFQLNPGMDHYVRFRLFDLIHRAWTGLPLDAGKLVIQDSGTAAPPVAR